MASALRRRAVSASAGPRALRPPDRGQLVTPGAARRPERTELCQRLGQRPVRISERGLQLQVPLRDGLGKDPALSREVRLRRGSLVADPPAVPGCRLDLARGPGLAQAEDRDVAAGGLVGGSTLPLQLGPCSHRRRDVPDGQFGRLERLERTVRLRPEGLAPGVRRGRPTGRLVPPPVRGGDERGGELFTGGEPCRLLLGELPETAGLRAQLGEDVLDSGEVCLGLHELLLRPPAPAFVTPDAGHLLEQGATLLRAQRQRLVHHSLPDEQERVLGEAGAVEQVDQVLETDALPVQEIVVLAGTVQAATELDHGELDGKQPVRVVQDEGDVRHPLGAPALGAGPDHVLAAPDAERPTLLAHGPAERVGQVGLAGAVRTDDRADPRAELHEGALREGLEPLDPQAQEPGRRGHDVGAGSIRGAGLDGRHGIGVRGHVLIARVGLHACVGGRVGLWGVTRIRSVVDLAGSSRVGPVVERGGVGRWPCGPCGAGRLALPADRVQGLCCRRGLGDAPRWSLADADRPAVDHDLDPEALLVVGTHGLQQPVDRPVTGSPLGVLLEPALRGLERGQRRVGRQLLRREGVDPVPGGLPAEVQADGTHQRLEGGCQERRADATPRWASPSPRRMKSPRSRRAASRASPGVLTIAARRADRTPSSSLGWRR